MYQISEQNPEEIYSSNRIIQALKQARTQIEAAEQKKREPIAIIGIGCRFPGGVNDPQTFWHLLQNGVDAIDKIPPQRWNVEHYYHPDPNTPGKMYTRYGGFLDEVDRFDCQFFGISPREAENMDPQQRLLLEVSWEAIENAGIAPERLQGSKTGVFMGIGFEDYSRFHLNSGDSTWIDAYNSLGNTRSIAAGRLSYVLGLQGPSLFLDTSCSSSSLGVHLACQSLRSGESDLALAGGVSLILSPEPTIAFCKLKALATDGRCKTFDAAADGYTRGEGCGIVILKRLSDAVADGDQILALIKGSAVNHDGKSNGLTAPNGSAQESVIRQALENAKVEPSQIQYVEAHGTGTPLGDPIEVLALNKVLAQGRSEDEPLKIGSVKTNFGHLEPAAGIASLIKVVLSLQHQQIPPHLHFKNPNPYIPWAKLPIVVPTELTPWDSKTGKRFAGVSSFGMSGTNVHLILEEAPKQATQVKSWDSNERPLHILSLSATTEQGLQDLAQSYEKFIESNSTAAIVDICFTANTGRSHFDYRLALVAESTEQLLMQLQAFTAKQDTLGLVKGQLTSKKRLKVAFLFTGQGSQYANMGRELYETQPTFRKALEQCDAILSLYLNNSLLNILYPEPGEISLIDETAYTQPAIFAIEYALAQLWKSWGIEPDAVMGHSIGEYVAATVAGVFSLENALMLIATRGRLMQALPSNGKMMAVLASENHVQKVIESSGEAVAIAAINGSQSIVISGDSQAIAAVCKTLQAQGVKTKPLQVSHAFHSPLMEPILREFESIASEIKYNKPCIPIISNVTGEVASNDITTPQYWVRHARQPVKFASGMNTLYQQGYKVYVEIGAKPILLGMGRQCLPEDTGIWLPSLNPRSQDWQQMLISLGQLYAQGVLVNWLEFDRDYRRQKLALPTYPFQRQRYWIGETKNGSHTNHNNGNGKQLNTIANYIHQVDTQQIVKILEDTGKFLPEQLELLPQLLQTLVEEYQHHISATSVNDKIVNVSLEEQPHNLSIRQRLEITPLKERHAVLIDYIEKHLSKVLGFNSSHLLKATQALNELGLDSLTAMELKNRFVKELEVDVAIERFIEGITIEQLADSLLMQFTFTTINASIFASDSPAEDMEEIVL
ncbi:acyltransferase domain-containing protein [Desmonostoc muscorum LEGE 12446]|nr:type I polyketide synthase [Desmonostoc muscorum]MCF2151836.1 acyltransferase domain-containing protein [Desmonostoc muscorum LEGE 12446]